MTPMAMPALKFEPENSVEDRLARVETKVEHIQSDITEMKTDIRRLDNKIDDRPHDAGIIGGRRCHPTPDDCPSIVVKRDDLDLGAPDVDPYPHCCKSIQRKNCVLTEVYRRAQNVKKIGPVLRERIEPRPLPYQGGR